MSYGEEERASNLVSQGLISQEDAERYVRVLGRPSQFVGLITTLEDAARHWTQMDAWQVEEDERLAKLEAIVGKPKGAKSDEQPRKRGRPPLNETRLNKSEDPELTLAKEEWRIAIQQREQDFALMEIYLRNEKERLRLLKEENVRKWDDYVKAARERVNRLKG